MFSDAAQRPAILPGTLPTKSQFLEMLFPLYTNLNLKVGSSHVAHVPQVTGHAALTPSKAHLFFVSLLSTHSQNLEILLESFSIFNRSVESMQVIVGVAVGEAVVGVAVGVTGEVVGPTGAADGLGEGLMEEVGALDGASLGTALGSKLGTSLGAALGASLGTALGSKLGVPLGLEDGTSLGEALGIRLGYSEGN